METDSYIPNLAAVIEATSRERNAPTAGAGGRASIAFAIGSMSTIDNED